MQREYFGNHRVQTTFIARKCSFVIIKPTLVIKIIYYKPFYTNFAKS